MKALQTTFKLMVLLSLVCSVTSTSFAAMDASDKKKVADFYSLNEKHLDLLNIKGYQQTMDYTCGPATVMSILHYYGKLSDSEMNHATEMKIAKEMGTSDKTGTSPQQIVTWLSQHGFTVKSGEGGTLKMLQDNLKQGTPTIVEWMDWGGHWVAVAGYDTESKSPDDDKDTILLADPAAITTHERTMNGLTSFNPDRFNQMWFDAQFFNPGHLVKGIYIIAVPK